MSEAEEEQAAAPAAPAASPASRGRALRMYRVALVQAVLLITAVIVALPFTLGSMSSQIFDRQAATLYAFPSGQPISEGSLDIAEDAHSFLKIAAIDLDEGTGSITLAISGHRICKTACPALSLTVVSLDDDAAVRLAFPPSAQLTLQPEEVTFSSTVQLPIRGQPIQYPFDDWVLWLGVAGTIVDQSGNTVPLTPQLIAGQVIITTQNQLRDFQMRHPVEIDPARVRSQSDPYDFIGVQELYFERPLYLGILSILLIVLIGVSAALAVFMRNMVDVVIGIGSLVIGIWGVRSILVPQPIPVVTSIDLALSLVILFVLLGLSIRAVSYFHRLSELPTLPVRTPLVTRIRRRRQP
jgi:hypothetical protein